tara:strand:- start:390 stop:743 length:354 start_codon:yes stop_codon:yes gene_type:complete
MSTIKVTNIQATGETPTRAVSGVAAAWFNYNHQTGPSIQDSVNISSISDDGSGIFTNTFVNSMSNSFWAAGVICRNNRHQFNTNTGAATGRQWRAADSGNSASDSLDFTASIHGDLA